MSCININCAVKSDNERQIACWLCDNLSHAKCAGIAARVADCLNVDRGVRWCCPKCKKIEISFYRFFKGMQSEFSEMERDLSALSYRFSKFTKMFNEFPEIDQFVNSPSRSSQKRKGAPKQTIPSLNVNASPCLIEVNSPMPDSENPETRQISGESVALTSVVVPDNLGFSQQQAEMSSDSGNTVSLRPCSSGSQTRELTVIPSRRSVFVSRLSPDTTVDDINFYLSSRVDSLDSISIYKLNSTFSNRVASFKILVSDTMFGKLVDFNFWPSGALVKEFVYRDNFRRSNLASLPKPNVTAPKN